MNNPIFRTFLLTGLSLSFIMLSRSTSAQAVQLPEEIEWTWEVHPAHINPQLPNVLLIGDSIARNYYPYVEQALQDKANVFLFSSSTALGDWRLNGQLKEFARMERVTFEVIHFNNGMHGWGYNEAQYAQAFPSYLATLRETSPDARLIWATTTPVRKNIPFGPTNERIDARNYLVARALIGQSLSTDNQYALMRLHSDLYQDDIHFNHEGEKIQAKQVVSTIESALPPKRGR